MLGQEVVDHRRANRPGPGSGCRCENTTFSPSSATSQPMTSRRVGPGVFAAGAQAPGPVASSRQLITAAAAPSPNRAVATRLLLDRSCARKVRAQSSTTSNSTRASGWPAPGRRRAPGRATPPAQPRPKIGSRRTSRPERHHLHQPRVQRRRGDAGRADRDDGVDVAGLQPGLIQRLARRLGQQLDRVLEEQVVAFARSCAASDTIRSARRNGASRSGRCDRSAPAARSRHGWWRTSPRHWPRHLPGAAHEVATPGRGTGAGLIGAVAAGEIIKARPSTLLPSITQATRPRSSRRGPRPHCASRPDPAMTLTADGDPGCGVACPRDARFARCRRPPRTRHDADHRGIDDFRKLRPQGLRPLTALRAFQRLIREQGGHRPGLPHHAGPERPVGFARLSADAGHDGGRPAGLPARGTGAQAGRSRSGWRGSSPAPSARTIVRSARLAASRPTVWPRSSARSCPSSTRRIRSSGIRAACATSTTSGTS